MRVTALPLILFQTIYATIDLNFDELEYLANHLLPEECRRLVAAAHFKTYILPNAMDQAEQAIPEDIPCIQLLLHWNSAEGEGKGETHEILEHRLRQMGLQDLADWLGKTVFHQLGRDLDDSLHVGFRPLVNETSTAASNLSLVTLIPVVENTNPKEWLPADSVLLAFLLVLIALTASLCSYMICYKIYHKCKNTKARRLTTNPEYYEMIENDSSGSEDRFDIREQMTTKNENIF